MPNAKPERRGKINPETVDYTKVESAQLKPRGGGARNLFVGTKRTEVRAPSAPP
ncbi:MAG TPA: hypothetical protein VFW05_00985 [Verrucomicrobiae bacterium]|nr:hypothetical protein [Verrucomicrobiae bacterium]